MQRAERLQTAVEDGVMEITLDHPESRNALDAVMMKEYAAALHDAASRDDVRAVLVRGANEAFCSGGDVKRMGIAEDPTVFKNMIVSDVQGISRAVKALGKPLVAALEGPAVGAGFTLALMADLRIASTTARFSCAYARVGLAPGDGAAYYLVRTAGLPVAMDLLLTGRFVDGQEALRLGLVGRVVAPEELDEVARKTARRVAAQPPTAIRTIRRLVYESASSTADVALDLAASQIAILQAGAEHAEAVAALRTARRQSS